MKKIPLPPVKPGAPGRPKGPRYKEQYGVILVCPDEAAQKTLYEAFEAVRSSKVKVVST